MTIELIGVGGSYTVLADGYYVTEIEYDVNDASGVSKTVAHKTALKKAYALGAKTLVGYCNGEIFSTYDAHERFREEA